MCQVGAYKYETQEEQEGRAWPLPKVIRWCAVFKTIGDRRLGDHLLAGLELLLPWLLPSHSNPAGSLGKELNRRRSMAEEADLFPTDMLVCFQDMGARVADCYELALSEGAPPGEVEDLEKAGLDIAPELLSVWKEAISIFSKALSSHVAKRAGTGSILLHLCWRLGRECGVVQRLLSDNEVSWGTYPDAMGTHCNAHVNNMVPPRSLVPSLPPPSWYPLPFSLSLLFFRLSPP